MKRYLPFGCLAPLAARYFLAAPEPAARKLVIRRTSFLRNAACCSGSRYVRDATKPSLATSR